MNRTMSFSFTLILSAFYLIPTTDASQIAPPSGLQVFYDFNQAEANRVLDRSGSENPLHLVIEHPDRVTWLDGALQINEPTSIASESAAAELTRSIQWSGEVSISAWIKPSQLDQSGPARIVTLSRNSSERNFTLGQDDSAYDVRMRTSQSNSNGIPSLSSEDGSVTLEKTHVVYTRNRYGQASIYINGTLNSSSTQAGNVSVWRDSFSLGLANEFQGGRPWLGTFFQVAVYNRSLNADEINQLYSAGDNYPQSDATLAASKSGDHFLTSVAPILVNRCFECHDSSTREGGLDVSNQAALLKGGNSGIMLVPGKAEESILMSMVEQDVMPLARASLTEEEKDVLRQWINEGAEWPTERIEASVYAHASQEHDIYIQRLTQEEYIATIDAVLGIDIRDEALRLLPKDIRADGFRNTAYNLSVDLQHIQAYAKLASIAVDKLDMVDFKIEFSRNTQLNENNVRHLIRTMGEWVLRGPLSEDEVQAYQDIFKIVVSSGGDYTEVCKQILRAMLQSPRFIYRIEHQRGDGNAWPRDNYEIASRLSYMLWGASPDRELLQSARQGKLTTNEGLQAEVSRMLSDPRVRDRSLQFISEWMNLDALSNLRPNPERFPTWTSEIAQDMQQETKEFFTYVTWELNQPLSSLFNAQVTFLTQRLAEHYGMNPKDTHSTPAEMQKYDVTSISERGGLLTHGSALTRGGDDASMVTRGLFVLHDVLRGTVQDAPPGVDTTPVPTEPGQSQRVISERRISNSSCGGCHHKFEPLAFGLEVFDGAGTYMEIDEHGNTLRQDGEVLVPGDQKPIAYETSEELMNLLANHDRVQETVTWKVIQFALGRPLNAHDLPVLQSIHTIAKANGGTYGDVMEALATSKLTRLKPTEAHP